MKFAGSLCAALAIGSVAVGLGAGQEPEERGRYYEDDAWYDITEWFDGNDYNPTDEKWWRWDDETYDAAQDTGGDRDNDGNWYGYSKDNKDDDWYYDYYDPWSYGYYHNDVNDLYDYRVRYYDLDNDGTFDAFVEHADRNGDDIYEYSNYVVLTDKGDKSKTVSNAQGTKDKSDAATKNVAAKDQAGQKGKTNAQQARGSKPQQVAGTIQKTKRVKVRGGAEHLVVAVQSKDAAQRQQSIAVDLGPAEAIKDAGLKEGEPITVTGPRAHIGDKDVVLARSFECGGKKMEIDRNRRSLTGKVLSTHKTKKIRGREHLMAMVEVSKDGKANKIAVDLGPAEALGMEVAKDSTLTFSGFPIKVKDKPMVLAQSIKNGDKTVQINRRPNQPAG
jgi:microcompartment protein CcmK/EutM